jgi:hypothetical protein
MTPFERISLAHKKTYVYFRTGDVRCNRVIIPAWPAPCFRSGLIGSQSGLVQVQV